MTPDRPEPDESWAVRLARYADEIDFANRNRQTSFYYVQLTPQEARDIARRLTETQRSSNADGSDEKNEVGAALLSREVK